MGIRSQNNPAASYLDKWGNSGTGAIDPWPPSAPTGPAGHDASGGSIVEYKDGNNTYRSHIFTGSGTFTVTALSPTYPAHVDYVVVGGGGGSSGAVPYGASGGGGGGGYKSTGPEGPGGPAGGSASPTFPISTSPGSYTVTIGAGGAKGGSESTAGSDGGNTEFYSTPVGPGHPTGVISHGGGKGAMGPPVGNRSGSQATGGGNAAHMGGTPTPVPAYPDEGYGGGYGNPSGNIYAGGGGGGTASGGTTGAGWPGPHAYRRAGFGGDGKATVLALGPGMPWSFGQGGGGGLGIEPAENSKSYCGGFGGDTGRNGGNGGERSMYLGEPGFANTGCGGGGGGFARALYPSPTWERGGSGGSGCCIVRYQIAGPTANLSDTNIAAKATGGAISYYNNKVIHTFTASGTFDAKPAVDGGVALGIPVSYVVIAGGGSGGAYAAGGGGAGGVLTNIPSLTDPNPGGVVAQPALTCPAGTSWTVTIGGGGAGVSNNGDDGNQGSNSVFGPQTAIGGGKGGGYPGDPANQTGGSGGGGAHHGPSDDNGGAGTANQGRMGGAGNQSGLDGAGGGGGGAYYRGFSGHPMARNYGGDGGIGIQLPADFRNPGALWKGGAGGSAPDNPDMSSNWCFAGGGGGGSDNSNTTGYNDQYGFGGTWNGSSPRGYPNGRNRTNSKRGLYGAGNGGSGDGGGHADQKMFRATSGEFGTGGGGGGKGYGGAEDRQMGWSGAGGSGVVFVMYPDSL